MKIEKLNENQIRCTLTKADLAERNLRISELAYGSEKTQNLFREMVKQADYEYGFEIGNTPIVVEAIPLNPDVLVLIITKTDDPEELDTRFSRFTPYKGSEEDYDAPDDDDDEYESIPFEEQRPREPSFGEMLGQAMAEEAPKHCFSFAFNSLAHVMDFAYQARNYPGATSLFKDKEGKYLLVLEPGDAKREDFKNACLLASEYAKGRSIPMTALEFMREHEDVLIDQDAVRKLASK